MRFQVTPYTVSFLNVPCPAAVFTNAARYAAAILPSSVSTPQTAMHRAVPLPIRSTSTIDPAKPINGLTTFKMPTPSMPDAYAPHPHHPGALPTISANSPSPRPPLQSTPTPPGRSQRRHEKNRQQRQNHITGDVIEKTYSTEHHGQSGEFFHGVRASIARGGPFPCANTSLPGWAPLKKYAHSMYYWGSSDNQRTYPYPIIFRYNLLPDNRHQYLEKHTTYAFSDQQYSHC